MSSWNLKRFWPALLAAAHLMASPAFGYEWMRTHRLHEDRHRGGPVVLDAFAAVSAPARDSVVRLEVDGSPVALGTVVAAEGLVVTKASEISGGDLTCRLPGGEQVEATLLLVHEENDLGLVRIHATGLTPILWSPEEVAVGQWAVSPGIEALPETAGIISVPPRKIPHLQALIGVQLDVASSDAMISGLIPGYGAEKAGLKAGDVVVAVNDKAVQTRQELTSTLRQYRAGQTVKLWVRRGEEEFEAKVPMMVHPELTGRGSDRPSRTRRFVGEVSQRSAGFDLVLQHDSVLLPWQCGGPLLNLEGKAIGLNIARAGRIASYALPAALVQQIIEELQTRLQETVDHQKPVDQPETLELSR